MNLHACLGVGPGHRLLLGEITATHAYSTPFVLALPQSPAPPKVLQVVLRPSGQPRHRGTNAESAERKERILVLLRQGLPHRQIADAVGVGREYVSTLASKNGICRTKRTQDEVKAIVARARRMMTDHKWTQRRCAQVIGISAPYLNILLNDPRHAN